MTAGRPRPSLGRATLTALLQRATLAALLLASPGAAQRPFTNPVLARPEGVADPHVLKWNGEYYLYATGDPIRAYHSKDLVNWTDLGAMVASSKEPGAWNQADVWAPEVTYRNGRFYLYYTASKASPDWRVGEWARRVGVAVADNPAGPFVDSGRPVTPGWAIDGHVFRDPDTGQDYLFYSYLYDPDYPGAGLVVDSLLDPFRVTGRPTHVTRGTEYWEDKDADPGNGSLRYTNEAPTVLERDGRYYVLYSGGSWDLPTYALAYATSPVLLPPGGMQGPGWTKALPPILRADWLVQGPGHNSVVKGPNNVDDITAYHARVVPFRSPGDRQTFIDRLHWLGPRPYLRQPSPGAIPPAEQPLFRDLFDRAAGALGAGWNVQSGAWRIANEHGSGDGLALIAAPPLRHYVLEANVRIPSGSGAAGVAAYHAGADRVEVWLDAARRALRTTGTVSGRRLPETATPLPADFRFDAWHQLLVVKNAGRVSVLLDGVRLQRHELRAGEGRAGLLARGTAFFDGIALTSHFRDDFTTPDDSWDAQGGTWVVEKGALQQVAGGSGRLVALKGDAAEHYELTASVLWRDHEGAASTAGVVAAASADGALVTAGFDHGIWPFARFHVRYSSGGGTPQALAVEMPRGFRYEVPHTLRVVKRGTGFTFFLDGEEVAAARFPVGEARPGLFTEGTRAAFTDVAMTRLGAAGNLVLDGSFEAERWPDAPGSIPSPWQLAGGASVVECCAYEGTRRLLLAGPDARATQQVALAPGSYTLWVWTTGRGSEPRLTVGAGSAQPRWSVAAGDWRRAEIEFEVTSQQTVTITLGASPSPGAEADGFTAVDNVYLFRR